MGPHSDGTHLLDEILHRIDEFNYGCSGMRPPSAAPPALWPSVVQQPMRFQSCAGMPAYENSSHAADLMALVNVETGGPIITGVDKSSRWYRRSPEDTLPDLFLDWERSGLIETVWSPKTGIVHAPYVHWRSGDHRPEGLLLAYGSGIPSSTVLPSIEVEDLAPSIAGRLGGSFGETDGRTLGLAHQSERQCARIAPYLRPLSACRASRIRARICARRSTASRV